MKDFRKKSGFGGYNKGSKSFGGAKPWERRGGDDRPMMHRATCAECGNACEVPFKPNGRKPVACNDCFRRDERGAERPAFAKRPFTAERAGGSNNDAQLKAINAKLDMILEILGADTAE